MARRRRSEQPGCKYHVMNRGVARRTLFDTRADYRFFLAGLARAVRRAEIQVLAYALMRTHFHLYLRSLGGMSEAMRRVQQRHARRFNRQHRRDGPLLRNRFLSQRVDDSAYSWNVVHYVHDNPVVARICDVPSAYEWSSARSAATGRGPPWLHLGEIRRLGLTEREDGSDSLSVMQARAELVEARLRAPANAEDDRLDATTPERVLAWMKRNATLADGAPSVLPLVGPRALLAILESDEVLRGGERTAVPGAGTYATTDLLAAGLLKDLACGNNTTIAALCRWSPSRAKRLYRLHLRGIELLPSYGTRAAVIVARCEATFSGRGGRSPGPDQPQ